MDDRMNLPQLPMEEYVRIGKELTHLLNTDPQAAISRARSVPRARIAKGMTTDLAVASILIDAGDAVRDSSAVAEGGDAPGATADRASGQPGHTLLLGQRADEPLGPAHVPRAGLVSRNPRTARTRPGTASCRGEIRSARGPSGSRDH